MTLKFKAKSGGALYDAGVCERQLNVLAHAQMIDLELGSRCGGHGVCGGDRIWVPKTAQVSPPTDREKQHLSDMDLEQGFRLACQCFPEKSGDSITLEIQAQ